jgi:argininosuccinate lyase
MSHIRSRFRKPPRQSVVDYTSSLAFDSRLYRHDITGSIAHANMLEKMGLISQEDLKVLIQGLNDVLQEIEQGEFEFKAEMEDIHMAIEARLLELCGNVAGKLHTARSRNDQIALDMRLFVKEAITVTLLKINRLQQTLVGLAEKNIDVTMPGYTHLQPAQPVLLAHHLLAYFEMFNRDTERFANVFKRTDVMPLGSGALAGVSYNTDRQFLARELGFSQISHNSMDAVSDRDFIIEYLSAASLCMMHLSRLAEEIIIWSSAEFGYVTLDDAYVTGSSIMPQKKNPDVAELARGRTGRVYGHLMAMLTTMKGLPLSYNRDLQEDKEGLFDTVDTLLASLEVFDDMLGSMTINKESMEKTANQNYILATDLVDYLVARGETFRKAHTITAKLVRYAIETGKALNQLKVDEYRKFSDLFDDNTTLVSAASSIASKDIAGGTAPRQVVKALSRAKKIIGKK